jgi:glycine/D-amino acid oxidase-like deaminating enzyme
VIDFLIAGQGLAGSLLAHALLERGASVIIADPQHPVSSSSIAAGILHPVTGRRIVKTWMADELIPFAIEYYNSIEADLFHKMPILEIFTSVQQRNEWMNKSAEPAMQHWLGQLISSETTVNGITLPFGGIEIKNTGWLDVKKLTEVMRQSFISKNIFIKEELKEDELQFTNDVVTWKDVKAKKVIFCNGYRSAFKNMFSYLPFVPAKGEIIEIHCPGLDESFVFNRGIYIIPGSNEKFKVGATFNWEDLAEIPTDEGRDFLVNALDKVLTLPYHITGQSAAVRPTNKDRRPFIGIHPENSLVGIFNGLGTKGAMLAPYFAEHFAEYLINGTALMKEVSIERIKL